MKKIYFFLFGMLCSYTTYAQTCVTAKQVSANYSAASPTVTFDLTWGSCTGTHNYKVWVFVDYQPVNANGTPADAWMRAPRTSSTPTFTLGSGYTAATYTAENDKGFWLYNTNGRTSRVTVALNIPTNTRFNWCAFASDYPPQARLYKDNYVFRGTPPFILSNNITQQIVDEKTLAFSALTFTPTTFTDATKCPGGPWPIIVYDNCDVRFYRYNLMPLPSSLSAANTSCTQNYGTGWRVPTLSELQCGWNHSLGAALVTSGDATYANSSTTCGSGVCGCYPAIYTSAAAGCYNYGTWSGRHALWCVKAK